MGEKEVTFIDVEVGRKFWYSGGIFTKIDSVETPHCVANAFYKGSIFGMKSTTYTYFHDTTPVEPPDYEEEG